MQHRRNLDWQIRRLLRKYPAPSQQTKEELWKGIASALDEHQPVKRSYKGLGLGIAALTIITAAGFYFWNGTDHSSAISDRTASLKERVNTSPLKNTESANVLTPSPTIGESGKKSVTISNFTAKKPQELKAPKSEIFRVAGTEQTPANNPQNIAPAPEQIIPNAPLDNAAKSPMEQVASVIEDLKLAPKNGPLLSENTGRYKHAKFGRLRDKSTWASLIYNIWDNPAYTGAAGKLSLAYDDHMSFFDYGRNAIYRDVFSADWQIPRTPISIGAYHDRALNSYSLKTGTALTVSARVLQIGSGRLTLGASVSSVSKKLFVNSFHYSDQYDINFGFNAVTRQRAFTSTNSTMGVDAGAWYQSDKFMGGISVKNANAPLFGYTEEGERLARTWHMSGGYRLTFNKLQVMPVVEIERNKIFGQATATVLATYNDRITIGGTYQHISPVTLRGDILAFVGVKAFNRLTVFTSYGLSTEMASKDINQHFIQSGLRFQLPQ